MTISIENLARIVSEHSTNGQNADAIKEAYDAIEIAENAVRDLQAIIEKLQTGQDIIDNLADDLMEEMTVSESENFKRLAGIE